MRSELKSVYKFKEYKKYLMYLVADQNISLSKLAEGSGCYRSYISKVINDNAHLTLDQAYSLSQFLLHLPDEIEYFKLLVEYERAASLNYKSFLKMDIDRRCNDYLELKNQVSHLMVRSTETLTQEALYYSTWLFAAIHISTSVPSLQTVGEISKRFGITESETEHFCEILQSMSLIKKEKNRWIWRSGSIHLPKESIQNINLQMNSLSRAMLDLQHLKKNSIHYSVIQSLSFEDVQKIKVKIAEWIGEFSRLVEPSTPQEVMTFRVDFFKT